MDLTGANIVVLDLETLRSADDCRHCGRSGSDCHDIGSEAPHVYARIGWENKVELGIAIGCYWDYSDMSLHWFDRATLQGTMQGFVERGVLLVSWNGTAFDFPLMRGLLRREAEEGSARAAHLVPLCDSFKDLAARGYDMLDQIWQVDPESKFQRGLNGLDAVAQANGLPAKTMDGATAPRLWRLGRYADVIAYNVQDVLKTRALFEIVCHSGGLIRGNGQVIHLPVPDVPR